MSTKEISAAAQALGRRGGLKSLGAKSKAELSAFGKAAAQKRWAAFARGEQSGERSVGGMFSAGAQQLEALAGAEVETYPGGNEPDFQTLFMEAMLGRPQKPRRALPKAGTVNALVLDVLREDGPNGSLDIAKELYYSAKLNVRNTTEAFAQVRNALSSLRSGGHVVSEPKPGSAKEKLWRLA